MYTIVILNLCSHVLTLFTVYKVFRINSILTLFQDGIGRVGSGPAVQVRRLKLPVQMSLLSK